MFQVGDIVLLTINNQDHMTLGRYDFTFMSGGGCSLSVLEEMIIPLMSVWLRQTGRSGKQLASFCPSAAVPLVARRSDGGDKTHRGHNPQPENSPNPSKRISHSCYWADESVQTERKLLMSQVLIQGSCQEHNAKLS